MADTKISALTELTGANIASNDLFAVVDTSATTTKKVQFSGLQSAVGSYAGLIQGLETSNAADADHDITVATGRARDGADGDTLVLSSAITKQIDAAWSVGTNAGGLDTGAVAADTWYYLWLIKRSDTAVVDALFSTSATAPTMPANYDLKRLIAIMRTDGSANIEPYYQVKDWFYRRIYETVLDGGTATAETAVTTTSAVPTQADSFAVVVGCNQSHTNQSDSYAQVVLRVVTGVDFMNPAAWARSGSGNAQNHDIAGPYVVPNTGNFFYHLVNSNVTSSNAYLRVTGFEFTR